MEMKATSRINKILQRPLKCPKCGRVSDSEERSVGIKNDEIQIWFICQNCGVVSIKPEDGEEHE